MVLRRVYLQNSVFYAMVLFLAIWHAEFPNNASVLALWFLPLIFLVYLSTQLNHTRNDALLVKIVHHFVFISKFILIYLTAGLLEFQSISIALGLFGAVILFLTIIEFVLLKGKTQLPDFKGLIHYTMAKVSSDQEAVKETTKYQNETNLYIFTLGFMFGSIHGFRNPDLEIRSILLNIFVLVLVIFFYRRLQKSNKLTFERLLERKVVAFKKLKKDYLFSQIMLHASMLVMIGVRIIDGENSISFLMLIPILMNVKLIQLHRMLARDVLTDEEKKLMNID